VLWGEGNGADDRMKWPSVSTREVSGHGFKHEAGRVGGLSAMGKAIVWHELGVTQMSRSPAAGDFDRIS
jgi:hypothetical protein